MDASRLLALLQLLEADANGGYSAALQSLTTLFSRVQSTPTQNVYPQIDSGRATLFKLLDESPVNLLVPSQLALLKSIGGENYFGMSARHRIEDILDEAGIGGPTAVAADLTAFNDLLQKFRAGAQQVVSGLIALGVEPATLGPDDREFGLTVPEHVWKNQLTKVQGVLKDWNFVLKTFLELGGDETPIVSLRGVGSGSPFQLFASVPELSAAALMLAVERLARLYKTILEIQQLREALRSKGVKVAEVDAVKAQEREMLEAGLKELHGEILGQAKVKGAERKAELANQLVVALRHMARYMNVGVDEEVSYPPPAPPSDVVAAGAEVSKEDADRAAAARWESIERGGAMRSLPPREAPVLQLEPPDGSAADEGEDGEKKGGEKKKK